MFFFIGNSILHLTAAYRTKLVPLTQPGAAFRAGELDSLLQVLDRHQTLLEVDTTRFNPKYLRYATTQVKQQTDKQSIPQILRGLFQPLNLPQFKVAFILLLLLVPFAESSA